MGCCSSVLFHEEEKGFDDRQFPYFDYNEQPEDEYKQLDTENDQRGDTAVEHIFKKTKMVYGQPPKDMANQKIDWKLEYQIEIKHRPCPYDFPAFEGDKPPNYDEKRRAEDTEEKETDQQPEKISALSQVPRRKRSKSKSKGKAKEKQRRRSTDVVDDECSI